MGRDARRRLKPDHSFEPVPPTKIGSSGLNQTEDSHGKPSPTQPAGWVPPLPRCRRGVLRLHIEQPLARIAGEGAKRSEAGEGIPYAVLLALTDSICAAIKSGPGPPMTLGMR